ncbi:unnamed protein product [Onchocerca ochengi]|nr:unnamed protein product [Onchocerca ochengi]
MKSETTKQKRFDFSRDPKVLEVRKRILSSMKNAPSVNESDVKYSCSINSDRNVESQQCYPAGKKNGVCSGSRFNTDFKSASGRPLVKKVLPVFMSNVNADKDKAQRYLGGKRVIPANQLLIHNKETGNESEPNKQTSVSGERGVSSIREGWKADESLKNFDDNIINMIEAEIMSARTDIEWTDVSGLEAAKKALKEIIVLPFLRPDIFKGIRAPPKGVLLFGPPGTGKTMIGRCVASQCKATFFNISASSITSKWIGEGEKLVRVLFAMARVLQPSVVFIDEIDSLLTSRNENEHESSRRIKTEFLIHLDGVATTSDERILILGATNRPQELDSAVKRRFAKRLYIGLPCDDARVQMIRSLLSDQKHDLSDDDVQYIAKLTNGYSGADMKQLCSEAAMIPVRNIVDSSSLDIASISADDIRPISFSDFEAAMCFVRPTVAEKDLEGYQIWNEQYGSFVSH